MSVPVLRGEELYVPFVGAIVERMYLGKKQILLQIRAKSSDKKYSECYEIPGGKLRASLYWNDIYLPSTRGTRLTNKRV